jgi:UDP-N-acetylmuramoylalanine--D-glutamate ligase
LFFDLCKAEIIGVTGTKGKGTTVSLITAILKSKINIWTGGNIGNAPIEFLDQIKKNDWVILELSSFQLQDLDKSPQIAVVLNITSDHLDYHKNQQEYLDAKLNIVRHQTKNDFAVINLDYLTSFKFAAVSPTKNDYYFSRQKSVDLGCFVKWNNKEAGEIILRTEEKDYVICQVNEIKIRGEHNLENICAAITASYLAGAKIKDIQSAIIKFKGLPLRIEFVKKIKGVSFYNDSASTNPDTTIAAIKSFSEPLILLVGGSSKNADYQKLGQAIENSTIKAIVAIGETAPEIIAKIQNKKNISFIKHCQNMSEAVKRAYEIAKSKDVILLSPASASFDWFKDYKDRGNQFNIAINNL